MVRFFTRKGTLSLQNSFFLPKDTTQYNGNIDELVSVLRQGPKYQIEKYHSHCGPRTKLLPALVTILPALSHTGICLWCWKGNRREDSWLENPTKGKWSFLLPLPGLSTLSTECRGHESIKAICTADARDWTPPIS